jgi:hypothetical protein
MEEAISTSFVWAKAYVPIRVKKYFCVLVESLGFELLPPLECVS